MKKFLFIDRDGTLILEPPDQQVDSLEKLEFYPGALENLAKVAKELPYTLVMVTNQDGLGTASFPEEEFWPAHNQMMARFKAVGVEFEAVLIDRSMPDDKAPTRKPKTGLLTQYLKPETDLTGSFVVGDRATDMELAQNLGCQGIWVCKGQADSEWAAAVALSTPNWAQIYRFLASVNTK